MSDDAAPTAPDHEPAPPPKRTKLRWDAELTRAEAAAYFRSLVAGLESGELALRQADRTLELAVPERVEVEIRAADKGDKGKFSFEVSWRAPEPEDEPDDALEITAGGRAEPA